jgi:hypothetical protein
MPCAIAQFIGVRLWPYLLELLAKQFAAVQARPLVTIGVAKGVAKGLPLHTVQGVRLPTHLLPYSDAFLVFGLRVL